ncbi:hypothetical protein FPQ18DRAFT_335211 [Pyronema domesticum]|nr:hypothetical protein FPQ18DRAFT_335211 [Pyronema domesticum]
MFRPVTRTILRQAQSATRQSTRFSSTSSAKKPCSLKSTVLRYAAVGGILYYYSTSAVFAQEPKFVEKHPPTLQPEDERPASLIDEILSSKDTKTEVAQTTPTKAVESAIEDTIDVPAEQEGGIGALEEEAGQQGAFNPETGEINWDCPCLGGMAHGPCGEDFKTAFSCFVYSTAEPKGADCIEKFKNMQTCFQQVT